MIVVKYEKYLCDYHRQLGTKTFGGGLDEVEEWLFEMMERPYVSHNELYGDTGHMHFPTPKKAELIKAAGPREIEIDPSSTDPKIWVHLIENASGIIFSDGKLTNGRKHWSSEVKEWLTRCDERVHSQKFNFVD